MSAPHMTPERFYEVFGAAIKVECCGKPPYWTASTPLLEDHANGRENKAGAYTLSEAIQQLVGLATEQAKDKLQAARDALKHAEERWRRIEAAASEMTNPKGTNP